MRTVITARGPVGSRRRLARVLRVVVAPFAAALLTVSLAATAPVAQAEDYPFRDPTLPLDARVDDIVGRLTLDEKVSLLHQWAPAIERLGVPAFRTGTEALHGVAWLGDATVFPQAIGLGSTWDTELVEEVGGVVGKEARASTRSTP